MAEVLSTFELRPGASAPDFALPDGSGQSAALSDLLTDKNALVVMFVCNHCPFVVHLASAIADVARDYEPKGAQFVAISANDVSKYPQDGPDKMVEFARQYSWDFPYLYDETQDVAKAYGAACTPDFFVFDGNGLLTWAGQFDSSRPGNGREVTGADLRAALDATILTGKADEVTSVPSSGCNIKWIPGNEPKWFGN